MFPYVPKATPTFICMISNLYSLTLNTSHVLSAQHTLKKRNKKERKKLYSFIAPAKSTPIQTQRECIEPLLICPSLFSPFSVFSVLKSNMKKIPFKSTAHRRSKKQQKENNENRIQSEIQFKFISPLFRFHSML